MFGLGILFIVSMICAYHFANRWLWGGALTLTLFYLTFYTEQSILFSLFLTAITVGFFLPLSLKVWRKRFISKPVFNLFKKMMPEISQTEQEAIDAGTVAWEGKIFSGNLPWSSLLKQPQLHLSEEEQAFLDGPVEEVCNMIDDWQASHELADLPPEVWDFIKKHGFLGMIIPQEFGGLGFSEWGHAAVLIKLYSRSVMLATSVSVPNSLGPAELLLSYGTDEQKSHYLPRLAKGQDIPCFALTSAQAGSDAASMPDYGIVTEGIFEGKKITGISLTWNKRYITLAPVASVLGLAFKLYDPDKLLGGSRERGITLALIPTNQPGITIGQRHFPLNNPFMNGPTQGKDVFIPLDWIIGGQEMIGQGWRMLMECLGAGRAISLPSSACGASKTALVATGAYARIRKQFGLSIGKFDGIQEPLGRIAGFGYLIESAIRLTVIAIEQGERPSVASAIVKYHCTELGRKLGNDAMDIQAGKGICLGPHNIIGRSYQAAPIGITVEGANILTRCLMIFGQGLIRCHPDIINELDAVAEDDLNAFDKAFFSHMKHATGNKIRAFVAGFTSGLHIFVPVKGGCFRYYQQFSRYASVLAHCSEVSMIALGGALKRQERLSARLGDILSYIYIGSSVLKRFHDDGYPKEDKPLVDWCCQYLIYEIQTAFLDFFRNFPNRFLGFAMKVVVFPIGAHANKPSDRLSTEISELIMAPTATRDRLAEYAHLTSGEHNPLSLLVDALPIVIAAEPFEKRIQTGFKNGELTEITYDGRMREALDKGIIDAEAYELVQKAHQLREQVIAVDDFSSDELATTQAEVTTNQRKKTQQ